MKEYNNLDYILEQQSDEEEIKELIEELETMTLEDFKLLDSVETDRYNWNGIIYGGEGDGMCISFYHDQICYAFVKLEIEPDDPFDLWYGHDYDEEFIELKELAIDALKEEL